MKRCCAVLPICVLFLAIPLARGDEAADTFEQLYGVDFKKAMASRDTTPAQALADQLLKAAAESAKDPALFAVFCEKVLALRQKQFDSAKGDAKAPAADLLLQSLDNLAQARMQAGDFAGAGALYQKAGATAATPEAKDQYKAKRLQCDARQKMQKQIDALKAKVEAAPDDVASRAELVRLIVVELDDPAQANKYVTDALDEDLKKHVPAAAKGVDVAPELACMELGDWYWGFAEKASPGAKLTMLEHAGTYYRRFLDLHKEEDAMRIKAKVALQKAEEAAAKAGHKPAEGGAGKGWVDVLKLSDLKNKSWPDYEGATWKRTGDAIQVQAATNRGGGQLAIPLVIEGPYELRVKVVKNFLPGGLNILLPVGPTGVLLSVDNDKGHLATVTGDKKDPVFPGGTAEAKTEYLLEIKVVPNEKETKITVKLDGKPWIEWQGPWAALSPPESSILKRKEFGIGVWGNVDLEFRSMELRMLPGGTKKSTRDAGTPASGKTAPPGPKH